MSLPPLGWITAKRALEEDLVEDIAEVAGLSPAQVKRRLRGESPNMHVRNVLQEVWRFEDDELGELTASRAIEHGLFGAINRAILYRVSTREIRRRLKAAAGQSLVRTLLAKEWPAAADFADELGDGDAAEARASPRLLVRIAEIVDTTPDGAAERLAQAREGATVRDAFAEEWPEPEFTFDEPSDDDQQDSAQDDQEEDNDDDGGPASVEQVLDDYEVEEGATLTEDHAEDRPYQAEALQELRAAFARHKKVCLSLPTGAGKTFVAAKWLADNLGGGRALWLTHREELVNQAHAELTRVFGADRKITTWTSNTKDDTGEVVIATVACQLLPDGPFQVLVVDEAHHRAAPTYKEWARSYRFEKELGLTATPERLDQRSLGYEHLVQRSFWQLVEQGYLAAPVRHLVQTEEHYELRKDRIRDDFEEASLRQLDNPRRNAFVVEQFKKGRQEYRKTLLFAINVDHAENLMAAFTRLAPSVRVASILGVTDKSERRKLVADFEAGRIDVLINCKVFVEGFNCRDIETVFLTRPTMSAVLYCQMVGRGTRIVGNKRTFHLVEFEDQLSAYADKLAGFWSLGEKDEERVREVTRRARVRTADPPALLSPAQAERWSSELHAIGGVLAYWDEAAFLQGATLVHRKAIEPVSAAFRAPALDRGALEAGIISGPWTEVEKAHLVELVRSDFHFHLYDFRRTDTSPPATAPAAVLAIRAAAEEVAPLSRVESFLGPPEQVDWGVDAAEWRREFITERRRIAGILRVPDDITGKFMPQKVFDVESERVIRALAELERARGMAGEQFFAHQERVYGDCLSGTTITRYRWSCVARAVIRGAPTFLDLRNG
jgi:superfamily II DNA or RNA helicase